MSVTSKVNICNMALSHLGNFGTVSNIDTPSNDKEITFSIWYDICRQSLLKMVMPNFAISRNIVAQLSETPPFGYAFYYEYPNNCLKVLGIGNARDKQNNYAVEENKIATDADFEDGLELRFIKDVTDVNQFSPEFKVLLSRWLAAHVCLDITQDATKATALWKEMPSHMSSLSGVNAQENMPVRISRSRFKASRFNDAPDYTDKK